MFGACKPSAAKTYSRIMLESLQQYEFCESCRALFVVDTSTLKDAGAFMKLIRDRGLHWPDIRRVFDADRRSRSGRRGTACVAGEARNHRGGEAARPARVATNQHYCQSDRGIAGKFERRDQHTQVCRPNRYTGRDSGVRTVGVREMPGRSAVSPAIGVRARSRDVSFFGRSVLLRRKQWLLPCLRCWHHLRKTLRLQRYRLLSRGRGPC